MLFQDLLPWKHTLHGNLPNKIKKCKEMRRNAKIYPGFQNYKWTLVQKKPVGIPCHGIQRAKIQSSISNSFAQQGQVLARLRDAILCFFSPWDTIMKIYDNLWNILSIILAFLSHCTTELHRNIALQSSRTKRTAWLNSSMKSTLSASPGQGLHPTGDRFESQWAAQHV